MLGADVLVLESLCFLGAIGENAGGIAVTKLDEMTEAVLELLRSPSRREELAGAGLAQVASRHTWERVADAHLELYGSVSVAPR